MYQAAAGNLVSQASNFGKQTEVFHGLEMSVSARFGRGGILGGGISTGRTTTNNCFAIDSPQQAEPRFCDVVNPWTGQTQIKLNGSYPLPAGFQASATFQNLPGIPILANRTYSNAEIAPSLGRNLGSCGGRLPCTGTVTVTNLIIPNTQFENRLTQLDVRLTKILRMGRTRVQARAYSSGSSVGGSPLCIAARTPPSDDQNRVSTRDQASCQSVAG